ncbi:MAG: DNA internalization-related competence protein ComEC/Rec2 [Ruminococcaceae bacterium]|nr:DNA internalization-related competence protein ComEC/Rec2 [Oscillospiraceae bacterium]
MRKLVWFSVGFAIASFIGAATYGQWLFLLGGLMLPLIAFFMLLRRKFPKCKLMLIILIGCMAGFLWFGAYDHFIVLFPRAMDGQIVPVTIEATDYSYPSGYGTALEGTVKYDGRDYRVKAYLGKTGQIEPGDTVSGTFRFRLTASGGKETPTSHRAEGIFLLAYAKSSTVHTKADHTSWKHYPTIWRHQLAGRIDEIFPQDSSGFAKALLLDDDSSLNYETRSAFKTSGIMHIVAVSGFHVSIVFSLLYTVLARRRVLACLVGIPTLFLFAAIIGFTPSVTRACLMQSLILISMLIDKEYDQGTSLAFAVLVMLLWNPTTILSVGFQLSVGCVLGIVLYSKPIYNYLTELKLFKPGKKKGLVSRIKYSTANSISITLSVMIVTTPMVAYYFGSVSIIGILTNLLTMWMISIIFYGILACLAISLISMSLAAALSWVVSVFIQFVLNTAGLLSKAPMGAVYTVSIYTVVWLWGSYGMLGIFALSKKKKPGLLLGCIAISFLLSQGLAWVEPMTDNMRVTVLDVGQGQSILLQSEGKHFLVDCGGDNEEKTADLVAETLLSQGVSRLDGLILTHYDEDHSGGAPYLLSRIRVDRLIMPDMEDDSGMTKQLEKIAAGRIQYISKDTCYSFGAVKITVFAPFSYRGGNESSLCVLFQREECDILITGDRSELGERVLLQQHKLPDLEMLVVGHHGSGSSTSQELLTATTPEIAFISVGRDNRYGHPADQVLNRLEEMGCIVYRTDMHGTIVYRG